ncbi:hypothetical protein Tco_0345625 [Tanacetum coccineum]
MPNRKKRECAIRFILGPKSVIAFFTAKGPIRHGSVKLHGSPSFWSKLLWTTAEHSSLSLTEKAAFFSFSLELWHPLACGSWPPEKALSKRPSNVGFIISEIEETFLDGGMRYDLLGRSNQGIEKWKKRSLDASFVAPSACFEGVDDLIPPLVDDDASSSKRFLSAIVKDSF